jgi:hypothetical protein
MLSVSNIARLAVPDEEFVDKTFDRTAGENMFPPATVVVLFLERTHPSFRRM